MLGFQFFQAQVFRSILEAWRASYQLLEERLGEGEWQGEFEVFGLVWSNPTPRIDFGAYYQKGRDAEALCIVGRDILLEEDFTKLLCD